MEWLNCIVPGNIRIRRSHAIKSDYMLYDPLLYLTPICSSPYYVHLASLSLRPGIAPRPFLAGPAMGLPWRTSVMAGPMLRFFEDSWTADVGRCRRFLLYSWVSRRRLSRRRRSDIYLNMKSRRRRSYIYLNKESQGRRSHVYFK